MRGPGKGHCGAYGWDLMGTHLWGVTTALDRDERQTAWQPSEGLVVGEQRSTKSHCSHSIYSMSAVGGSTNADPAIIPARHGNDSTPPGRAAACDNPWTWLWTTLVHPEVGTRNALRVLTFQAHSDTS